MTTDMTAVEKAVDFCGNIDFEIFAEGESFIRYAEIADKEAKKGRSEEEIIDSLGRELTNMLYQYVKESIENTENYIRGKGGDDCLPLEFDYGINCGMNDNNELVISFECSDRYDNDEVSEVKHGYDITDLLDYYLDEEKCQSRLCRETDFEYEK